MSGAGAPRHSGYFMKYPGGRSASLNLPSVMAAFPSVLPEFFGPDRWQVAACSFGGASVTPEDSGAVNLPQPPTGHVEYFMICSVLGHLAW
jgi:hypothetical protein